MKYRLFLYDKPHWEKNAKVITSVDYASVKDYKTLTPQHNAEEIKKIESETSEDGIDVLHKYLILFLENGETSTFRHSNVILEGIFDVIEYRLHVKNRLYDTYESFTDAKIIADEIIKTMTEYGTYADGAVTIQIYDTRHNELLSVWTITETDVLSEEG